MRGKISKGVWGLNDRLRWRQRKRGWNSLLSVRMISGRRLVRAECCERRNLRLAVMMVAYGWVRRQFSLASLHSRNLDGPS